MNLGKVMMSNARQVGLPEASNGAMNVSRYISKSVLLLTVSVVVCCGLYLLSLSVIGQAADSYDASASTSSAVAAPNNIFDRSRDIGAAEDPSLQRPTQTVCHFYGC